MGIASIDPTTGEKLKVFEPLRRDELEAKLAAAQKAFETYRYTSFEQRATWLRATAQVIENQKQAWGELITLEMGKTLRAAIAEVEKCAMVCRYYADHGAGFLADVPAKTDATQSFVRYLPLGVVLAVMPWNFPFWQVFRFAAPALMAGNVGVLKHASNVPQCALTIERIFQQGGFPTGVFQTLLVGANQVADIIADDRVRAATLTGSEGAGSSLAAAAGKALKKTVLELGGTDPFIVMPSADLAAAATTAVKARILNSGQTCIAAKRYIVHGAIADSFEQQVIEQFKALTVGDPRLATTDIGPLATPAILHEVDQQVQACVAAGATVLVGGDVAALQAQLPDNLKPGNFYPPTLLSRIPAGTPADQDEIFGPVALLFRVANLDEAIALANSTPLGLGASAWTHDAAERDRLVTELDAGAVFINGMVKSDPRLPFGGIKRSGYGRELSIQGIQEFVNIKSIWIK